MSIETFSRSKIVNCKGTVMIQNVYIMHLCLCDTIIVLVHFISGFPSVANIKKRSYNNILHVFLQCRG